MFALLLLAASGCDPACDPDVARYVDADGDGHGDPDRPSDQCDAPTAGDDCDDGDAARHPGATESCSTPGLDDDCDGLVDDADLDVDGVAELHADADGDGFGSAGVADVGCAVDGLVLDASDCDDTRASAFPGAPERCDGVDTDCDPATGETGLVTWFPDGADPEDWTAKISQGDASPTMVELDTPGELDVCEGEWAARFEITAAVRLVAPAGAALTTIDPAANRAPELEIKDFLVDCEPGVACGADLTLTLTSGAADTTMYLNVEFVARDNELSADPLTTQIPVTLALTPA